MSISIRMQHCRHKTSNRMTLLDTHLSDCNSELFSDGVDLHLWRCIFAYNHYTLYAYLVLMYWTLYVPWFLLFVDGYVLSCVPMIGFMLGIFVLCDAQRFLRVGIFWNREFKSFRTSHCRFCRIPESEFVQCSKTSLCYTRSKLLETLVHVQKP